MERYIVNDNITKKEIVNYVRKYNLFTEKYIGEFSIPKEYSRFYETSVIIIKDKYITYPSRFMVIDNKISTDFSNDTKIVYRHLPGNTIFQIIDEIIKQYKLILNDLKISKMNEDFK